MQSARWRNLLLALSLAFIIGMTGYGLWVWQYVVTVPIEYNPAVYPLALVKSRIQNQERRLILDTGAGTSAIRQELFDNIPANPITNGRRTDTALGTYVRKASYGPIASSGWQKMPPIDGLLGNDIFESAGIPGDEEYEEAVRITVDFVRKTLTIDNRPARPRYVPSADSISVPLHREDKGWYFASLSVNEEEPMEFLVDTGASEVRLPIERMQQITGKKKPSSVAVELGIGKAKIKAIASPDSGFSGMGLLGLPVLSRYRVVIDYRDKMLYLEPPR